MKQWTALFFTTTAIHAILKGLPVYAVISAALCVSSYAFHTSDKTEYQTKPLYWIDQACIFAMGAIGLYYMVYHAPPQHAAIGFLTASIVFLLFWGGYLTDSCCFDPEKTDAVFSHCCMHLVGAIGHHCVIAGLPAMS